MRHARPPLEGQAGFAAKGAKLTKRKLVTLCLFVANISWESLMNFIKSLSRVAVAVFALGSLPAFAQPGAFGGGHGPALKVVPPPRTFSTSDEHYAYMLAQAKVGAKHTIIDVPGWDG